jgi:hypothetical protein
MSKVNKHRFNNYIFSITLNLDKHFDFVHNYLVLHKTPSRPYVRSPATLIWVAT